MSTPTLSFHPFVRSAPSFRPDLHTARAVAHSGGQGWPVFGPPRQRRAASLTVASTAARLVASVCLAGTHQTWRKKRAQVQLKKLAMSLNAWLLDKCIAYAKAHRHPELTDQTIWQVFEAERPKLVPYAGRFDGFHAVARRRSRRPAWFASTITNTRWRPARSGVRSRFTPMPTAL